MSEKNTNIYGNLRMDNKDIEIIKIMENDARISILELSKRVKLSHDTVRYRLNKLIKQGIIEKFIVRVNKKKLGYNLYAVIMISLWNYSQNEWDNFLKFLMENPKIVAIEKVSGDFDLKIAFWAKDSEEMDQVALSIKISYPKIIKNWHSFIFTKLYKWKELPF